MFGKRSLRVKMVKDEAPQEDTIPIDYDKIAKVATKSVATCILTYIGADTLRKVIIYATSAKI